LQQRPETELDGQRGDNTNSMESGERILRPFGTRANKTAE
jgi:hypothetical protein